MRYKKLMLIISLAIVGTLFLMFLVIRPQKISTFTDSNGRFYECSKSIWVKRQAAEENGRPGFTPINTADTTKYCKLIGIE